MKHLDEIKDIPLAEKRLLKIRAGRARTIPLEKVMKRRAKKSGNNYLKLYQWQATHIQEGLRQADAKKFAKDAEVSAVFARK